MRVSLLAAVIVLVASPAFAQPANEPQPSPSAREAINLLTSSPTAAAAKWRQVFASHPEALLRAIASAEKRGWKPTGITTGGANRRVRGLAPISAARQDLSAATGDGEMLIWNWDDGDPWTVEGTVYFLSYHTGFSGMFNVQLGGVPVESLYVVWEDSIYADAPVEPMLYPAGATPLFGDVGLRRVAFQRPGSCEMCMNQVDRYRENRCNYEFAGAAADCIRKGAAERLRHGIQGAIAGATLEGGLGCAAGAVAGGLAGCVGGGAVGAVDGASKGFLAGVIGSFMFGTDYQCYLAGQRAYERCMARPVDYSQCWEPCGWRGESNEAASDAFVEGDGRHLRRGFPSLQLAKPFVVGCLTADVRGDRGVDPQ